MHSSKEEPYIAIQELSESLYNTDVAGYGFIDKADNKIEIDPTIAGYGFIERDDNMSSSSKETGNSFNQVIPNGWLF